MSVFLCRQNPYGDKINQSNDIQEIYIKNILHKRFMPIPYLHNLQVIKDIGITTSMTKHQICSAIEKTSVPSLGETPTAIKQKRNRIMKLLNSNVDHSIMIIPSKSQWLIAKCSLLQPYIDIIENVMYQVHNSHAKKMCIVNDYNSAIQGVMEPSFAIGLKIVDFVMIDKPKHIRLPPVSLQHIENEEILKIISKHFK